MEMEIYLTIGSIIILLFVGTYFYLKKNLDSCRRNNIKRALFLIFIIGISFYGLRQKNEESIRIYIQMLLIYLLTMMSFHDLKEKAIPMGWLMAGVIMGLVWIMYHLSTDSIMDFVGAVSFLAIIFMIGKVTKGGIGIGDGGVMAMISLYCGWHYAFFIFTLSIFITGITGILLFAFKKVNRKTSIPFIPFVLGSLLFVIWW